MDKRLFIGSVITALVMLGSIWFLAQNQQTEQEVMGMTDAHVRAAFAEKYGPPTDRYLVEVERDTGMFAKGSIRFTDEPGGGLWFAARTTQGWELVFDGNGIIPCSAIAGHDFPADMVPQCLDEESGELLQR
jgi:hypothetical protein